MKKTKKCPKCGKTKHIDAFHRRNAAKDGLNCWCKKCNITNTLENRKKDPPQYRIRCRASKLKHLYGFTLAQYDEMLVQQDGVCAICHSPETSSGINILSVDHNHKTGKVRGLLCRKCNSAIGLCDDDPKILAEAVRYLL